MNKDEKANSDCTIYCFAQQYRCDTGIGTEHFKPKIEL